MKKNIKPLLKSIISFALAIALVMGAVPLPNMGELLPDLVIKANAAEYTANPTTKDELVPLASSGSVSEAHVVKYANKEWYVIGYDGVGLASESGTMTLFLKGTLGSHEFSNNYSNVYADSSIHSYLGSYLANTANFTSNESAAVVARTLSGGASTGNSYSSHVSGESVNANLWLLSAAEARKLPQNIIKSGGDGNGWWLRSPGNSGSANYMPVSPADTNDVPKESGAGVGSSKSVRAAMLLDLNSVIYSSETNTLIAQEAEAHNITVSVDNNQGSVVAPSRADKGETVKFTITPEVGYAVDTVKFNDTSLSPVNGVYSFTMPNSDVTISVTFNQIYKVEDHIEQDGDTYTIKTAKGWEVFCECVKSDTYHGFGGKTVKLGLDITDGVTVSAGILGKPFYGTFDGDGHTLAVALNSTEEWVAPFSVFSGSIKNLTVTGTVEGSNYAGGLTGFTYGGSIENVTVNADISGSSKIGGITGYCDFGSLLVKNTVFNGSLQCDGDVCGLIGWASENVGYNQAITIENCLFNGSYTCDGEFHPITVRNSNSKFEYKDNGAYYTVAPKLSSDDYIICAGTHVSTITANSKFEITTDPTFSFDSVNYYAEGTSILLRSSESIESVVINNGAVEVTDNKNGTYSFTMPDCNVTVVDKLMQMISFESATQTKIYGDEDFTVTATHSVGDGEVSYTVTEGTDVADVNSSTGAVTIKKAGTAIITATAAAKNNFAEATAQYTLTVNPKYITIPTAISGLKWTGDEQTGVTDDTGYTVTDGKARNVGSYTATAVLTDKDNTKWNNGSTDDQSIAWSIAKADGPAAPTGLTGTAPTTDGGSDGKISGVDSTMEYSNNSSFESATDCSGTEVTGLSEGTYYVRVKETETHEAGVYATVTVPAYSDNSAMVKKAPIPKTNLVYNGSPQALVEPGEAKNGTLQYAIGTKIAATEAYNTSIPKKTDVGTYYVWYKVVGENHNETTADFVEAEIKEGDIRKLSFNPNGGSGTMKEQFVTIGTETALRSNAFTRDGYRFDGWNTKQDGSGSSYEDEGTITLSEHMVLYAQWKAVEKHTHHLELVNAVEPGCETEGHKAYYRCTGCDKWFADAAGSVEITDKNSVIRKATGHRWDSGEVTKEATYTETGIRTYTCKNDGNHTKDEVIPVKQRDYSSDDRDSDSDDSDSGSSSSGVKRGIDVNSSSEATGNSSSGNDTSTNSGLSSGTTGMTAGSTGGPVTDTTNGTGTAGTNGNVGTVNGGFIGSTAAEGNGGLYDSGHQAVQVKEILSLSDMLTAVLSTDSSNSGNGLGSGYQVDALLIDNGMPLSDVGGTWSSGSEHWHYTKSDGAEAHNEWLNLNYNGVTCWYFFDEQGDMATGWVDYKGERYYLVPETDGWKGRMAEGWVRVDDKWYYFESTAGSTQGRLLRNGFTPDGHFVGDDGALVQ